jgi:hypothetical protein
MADFAKENYCKLQIRTYSKKQKKTMIFIKTRLYYPQISPKYNKGAGRGRARLENTISDRIGMNYI